MTLVLQLAPMFGNFAYASDVVVANDGSGFVKNVADDRALDDGSVASVTSGGNTVYYSDFSAALDAWTAGSTLTLCKDVTTSAITVPTGEHTLDLNGYGILMIGNDRVITINQNVSLELNDSTPERVHYITLNNYRATAVSDTGTESFSNGSGVIKVTGGYLAGGYRSSSGSHNQCGAGVFNRGTFVMNGGNIVGNTMNNNSGGAIRNSGYFILNNGAISYNKATGNGGEKLGSEYIFITRNSGDGIYDDVLLTSVNDYTWNY